MKAKRKRSVEGQKENDQNYGDETDKAQDEQSGRKGNINETERQEKDQGCDDSDDKEQDKSMEGERKRRKIQTKHTSDDELDESISTDPQPKLNVLENDALIINCDWIECEYKDTNMYSFAQHVLLHLPHMELRSSEDGQQIYYNCMWHLCDFETTDRNEIARHIAFHCYHTTLKCIGKDVASHNQLPKCNRNKNTRNNIPSLPNEFTCCWEACDSSFIEPHKFFHHIDGHVKQLPSGEYFFCGWANCSDKYTTIAEFEGHVRTHTEEKTIACPNCGSMFESSPEYINHLVLPEPEEVGDFTCNQCFAPFTSLAETWRHILATHPMIYYCTQCKYKCNTSWGFEMHSLSHMSGKRFPDDDCTTVDPHTLHPLIAFDDRLDWALGTDPVLEPQAEPPATSGSLFRDAWTKCKTCWGSHL